MSKFKRKFRVSDSKRVLEEFGSEENSESLGGKSNFKMKSCKKIGKVLEVSQGFEANELIGEIPKVLKNLYRRESLCQAHKFNKMRNAKLEIMNPDLLKQEYLRLVERYKKVKGKCLMTPCRIPRSGLNILPGESSNHQNHV